MALVVYNTLSRSKEKFVPLHDKKVNMFVCGLTVYDDAHMGHAKVFVNFDVIARWLRNIGYSVKYIQNITDVDDKIINRAKERCMAPIELARHYEARFLEDLQAIGAKESVDMFPRSHDYIDTIQEQIQLLANKNYAYYLDGDVYYDVAKFKRYTKLSGMSIDMLQKHRIEPKEGKRHEYDFALWKTAKPGEPSWKIKVKFKEGEKVLEGRPGWHIEDTAMTYAIFGPKYDLHGGASELIFPHHTNEIAQAEAAFDQTQFVKYWLHAGVLNMKGQKMSKSLKNFITIREVLSKYSTEEIRYMLCSTHYRKDIDYTDELMERSRKSLRYMYSALSLFYNMKEADSAKSDLVALKIAKSFTKGFAAAMNDDFDTPLALSGLIATINALRSFADTHEGMSAKAKHEIMDMVVGMPRVIGLLTQDSYKKAIPGKAYALIKERDVLRASKEFDKADAIRSELESKYGVMLEDTEHGTIWYAAGVVPTEV
jgi:cysteinyl-tRNA synthetase